MNAQDIAAQYKQLFKPDVFLEIFYGCDTSTMRIDAEHILGFLNEVFSNGMITGKRLLDVGSGPSISSVIAASCHFDDIYLSDIAPQNLEFLNEWWTGTISPLDHVIKYCLGIEQSSQTVAERNKDIRDKVNGILTIDVQRSNPLTPNRLAGFDAIVSSFCLDCASSNREDYKTAVSNVASLLKKNGKLVILGALELASYTVGDATFQMAAISEKDIREIYKDIGFEVEVLKIFNSERKPDLYNYVAMVAKKVIG